jgi:NAD(P)-dependent dehydrogenase (short-subunit alcohol dehydrogenase family)
MALPELRGRTAVITGASRGLGAGLARSFAARGLQLGLCARRLPELGHDAEVLSESVDVRDLDALCGFTTRVAARFGAIDLWVNNAGLLGPLGPLRKVDVAAWRESIEVNLGGVFHGCRAYVEHLHGRGGAGVLINLSSGAARNAYSGWSAYCASKAAVDRLTQSLQLEEEAFGLRCYAVSPGRVETEMQVRIRAEEAADFPAVEKFRDAAERGAFNPPDFVAQQLLEIAFDPERSDPVLVTLPYEWEVPVTLP